MLSTADPLDVLYRDVVLEHFRKPRNRKPLDQPSASALVQNPLCGDQVRVEIRLERDRLSEVSVRARGCSITVAAGSVMTELVRGCRAQEVRGLMTALQQIVHGEPAPSVCDDRLRAFARVAQLPARERCALLPWEGLAQALESDSSSS